MVYIGKDIITVFKKMSGKTISVYELTLVYQSSRFLVRHRNPGPLGQVRVQRLCHLYDSMLLNDQVVPITFNQGVTK